MFGPETATHLVLLLLVLDGAIVSNRIGVKFGRNVLQVNRHRLKASDF